MTALQIRDELYAIWSAARAEANLAYEAWCGAPGGSSYAVYRAAEDRADAAEDALRSAFHRAEPAPLVTSRVLVPA